MSDKEADMTVLRAFQTPSKRGTKDEGKDKLSCPSPRSEDTDREVTVIDPLTPTLYGG